MAYMGRKRAKFGRDGTCKKNSWERGKEWKTSGLSPLLQVGE